MNWNGCHPTAMISSINHHHHPVSPPILTWIGAHPLVLPTHLAPGMKASCADYNHARTAPAAEKSTKSRKEQRTATPIQPCSCSCLKLLPHPALCRSPRSTYAGPRCTLIYPPSTQRRPKYPLKMPYHHQHHAPGTRRTQSSHPWTSRSPIALSSGSGRTERAWR